MGSSEMIAESTINTHSELNLKSNWQKENFVHTLKVAYKENIVVIKKYLVLSLYN